MEHTTLLDILRMMTGTEKELDLVVMGYPYQVEVRNVLEVQPLPDSLIRVATRHNTLWLNPAHVSVAWQSRADR